MSYTPDFYLPNQDEYFEVKGWMDPMSKLKLEKIAKCYPEINIRVIGESQYRKIEKAKHLIPLWED